MRYRHQGRNIFVLLLLLVFAPTISASGQAKPIGVHSPARARAIIAARARAVVSALKRNDLATLSRYVHPVQGVRFSPYVSADKSDLTFNRLQLRALKTSQKKYNWGEYDGSGDPISLTWKEYHKKFIYPRDFSSAKEIYYNTAHNRGNSVANLNKTFPRSLFIEFHIPSSKPDTEYDWRSLWLVWQLWKSNWYLGGIASDQWTI